MRLAVVGCIISRGWEVGRRGMVGLRVGGETFGGGGRMADRRMDGRVMPW